MREALLDDFVVHVENQYAVDLSDIAATLIRRQSNGCRGERLTTLAALAAQHTGQPVASLMESFGSDWARRHCGRYAGDMDAVALWLGQIAPLAGDDIAITDNRRAVDSIELVLLYRGLPGGGDVVAGLLDEWRRSFAGTARLERQDLSPLPGAYVRFRLTGTRN